MIIAISGLTIEKRCFGLIKRYGVSGAGKDTVAQHYTKQGYVPLAFADVFKRHIQEVFKFSDEQLWGPSEYRNEPDPRYPRHKYGDYLTPRLALQQAGDAFGRFCYQDIWANYAMEVARKLEQGGYMYFQNKGLFQNESSGPQNVVITDLRRKNEALAVRKAGGFLLRVIRPVSQLPTRSSHESEKELSYTPNNFFDQIIWNDAGVADLWNRLECLKF